MISNFRDLGGKTGYNNKITKKGMLYRSSEICNLSTSEKNTLTDLKMKTIVDFRNKSERLQKPDDTIDYVSIDIFGDNSTASPDVSSMLKNAGKTEEMMSIIYKDLVVSKSVIQGYRQFLDLLINQKSTPLVFHCTFGKDRRGYGAALILKILGVSESDILANYLESNEQLKDFNKELLNNVATHYNLSREQANYLKPMFEVESKYLELSFATIDHQYGNFNNYLKAELDFDEVKVDLFRERVWTGRSCNQAIPFM